MLAYLMPPLLAAAYYCAALLGLLLLSETNNIALVWPATAILLAYLYLNDLSKWPLAIALCWGAGILANYTLATNLPLVVMLLLTFTDVFVDAVLAAVLLRRFAGRTELFNSVRGASLFIVLACVATPAVGGVLGAGTISVAFGAPLLNEWFKWWASTAVSVSLVAPLLIVFSIQNVQSSLAGKRLPETSGILLAVLGVGVLIYYTEFAGLLFLVVPILLWAALRFGVFGVSVIGTLVAAVTVVLALTGHDTVGVFSNDAVEKIQFLQMFLMATYIPTLFCAIVFQERSVTERTLRQAQKMEAIGQLSGGIAHDFNNILGVIQGNLELAESSIANEDEVEKRIKIAHDYVLRGSALSRKLLSFSRSSSEDTDIVNVNEPLQELTSLIMKSLTASVDVKMELENTVWPVEVDHNEFENAVLNLVLNARDAMPNGGLLMIETANKVLGDDYVMLNPGSQAGEFVLVSFSDTGTGMTDDVQEKAFEPFFSTKETGSGTGLGLSMVYGFAQRSGGHVKIYSEQGIGTTVHLYLPRVVPAESAAAQSAAGRAEIPRGSETILVVDDEAALVDVAVSNLEALGYKTFQANNGQEALALIDAQADIDLLFCDVIMPGGMDGYELALAARRARPSIKILLTSGFTRNRERYVNGDEAFVALLASRLLPKPYNKSELASAVRHTLDGEGR